MSYNFFATISRMKYIQRWALMRNSRPENLSEHSLEVAMIAHALCTIGNVRYGRNLDGEKAALISLYHDASEIITGDMPTPVKYFNHDIRDAYKEVEEKAEDRLLSQLPDDLRPEYERIFRMDAGVSGTVGSEAAALGDENADPEEIALLVEARKEEQYMRELVKAADKISAMIKCIAEETSGNAEFRTAKTTIEGALLEMRKSHPEVGDFMDEFMEPYGNTLDELLS